MPSSLMAPAIGYSILSRLSDCLCHSIVLALTPCSYSRSFFFFSSRRRHTRFDCDWSSDVCSSDLILSSIAVASIIWFGGNDVIRGTATLGVLVAFMQYAQRFFRPIQDLSEKYNIRSEERRVGKECRSRWSPYH